MNLIMPSLNIHIKLFLRRIALVFSFLVLSFTSQAANGPSVNQLNQSLNSTWDTLKKITNCDLKPPQDSLCIQKYHGKTITVKIFGHPVNALILFETFTTSNLSGPIITQQSGFLIGPINDYGYKIIHEKVSLKQDHNRQTIDNGLKVFAHSVVDENISPQGIELNKGQHWLDSKNEPWIYHWSALAQVHDALKELEQYLNSNYRK